MKKTWGTVKSECISLGFEKAQAYTKNRAAFLEAANRAQTLIAATVRPVLGRYVITQEALPLAFAAEGPVRYAGEPLSFSAEGVRAYWFEADGPGTATVTDDDGTIVLDLGSNRSFRAYRGFSRGAVTVTFAGEYQYNIRNLALYNGLLGPGVEDIPAYGKYAAYDLSELTREGDRAVFMDFADDKPVKQDFSSGKYRYVSDYRKSGRSTILLDREDRGQFEVWYKKYPAPITSETPDGYELELDYDGAVLMPLLMAHYIWLDDDERKAVLYYNEYDDLKNQLLVSQPPAASGAEYENTTGWW